jgi:RNA polymerase sigma-70 factor (ECF subfamily)
MANPNPGIYRQVSDEHLMTSLYNGDTDAFNELYLRYHKRALYYFYRMLGNSYEKARDFLQDLFIKIIERPDLFDPSRRFSTWLFSVAHNMCKNEYRRLHVRRNTVQEENLDLHSEFTEPDEQEIRLTADQIFDSIENLEETEKTIFLLYYREEFTLQEIGKVLDLPEGTVKSKLFYTRKKITRRFQIHELKK